MMEELVHQLANLETGWQDALQESDVATADIDIELDKLHAKIDELMEERATIQMPYVLRTNEFMRNIKGTQAQIIEAWDGEKKTLQGDDWVLKFRTTTTLEIYDDELLLFDIIEHTSIGDAGETYISGFNKTAVRKYMTVHPQPDEVAELIEKTTVKLEV